MGRATEWMGTREAADAARVSQTYVAQLVRAGTIEGRKAQDGFTWQVRRASFNAWQKEQPKPRGLKAAKLTKKTNGHDETAASAWTSYPSNTVDLQKIAETVKAAIPDTGLVDYLRWLKQGRAAGLIDQETMTQMIFDRVGDE